MTDPSEVGHPTGSAGENVEQMPVVIECAGLRVDFAARTIHARGRLLPVTCVFYSAPSPERPGSDRIATEFGRHATELVYKTPEKIAAALTRPIPAMPEAVHFNVLCENGWWVEVGAYPEDDELEYVAAGETVDYKHTGDAASLLGFYEAIGRRPTYVPSSDPDDYDDPWGGLSPGSWDLVNV